MSQDIAWFLLAGVLLAIGVFHSGYVEGARAERRRANRAVKRAWEQSVGMN